MERKNVFTFARRVGAYFISVDYFLSLFFFFLNALINYCGSLADFRVGRSIKIRSVATRSGDANLLRNRRNRIGRLKKIHRYRNVINFRSGIATRFAPDRRLHGCEGREIGIFSWQFKRRRYNIIRYRRSERTAPGVFSTVPYTAVYACLRLRVWLLFLCTHINKAISLNYSHSHATLISVRIFVRYFMYRSAKREQWLPIKFAAANIPLANASYIPAAMILPTENNPNRTYPPIRKAKRTPVRYFVEYVSHNAIKSFYQSSALIAFNYFCIIIGTNKTSK